MSVLRGRTICPPTKHGRETEREEREMERERGLVPQPPAKRMKLAPVVPASGGGGGGQVPSPRWRRLRQTLLVVLFLVRA